jgi:hypothetical protein
MRIPLGMASRLLKTEAPVVVKPAIDSKYASLNDGVTPEMIYGRAPKNDMASQLKVTTAKPSLIFNSTFFWLCVRKKSIRPDINVITREIPRDEMSVPLYTSDTKKGMSINREENNSTIPVRLKTRAVFIEEGLLPA